MRKLRNMQMGISLKKLRKRRRVFHGIVVRIRSTERLSCHLVEVAKLAPHLMSIQKLSNSASDNSMSNDHIECGRGLMKRVSFAHQRSKGECPVLRSESIRRVLRRVIKHYAESRLFGATYLVDQLPTTTTLLEGKFILRRRLVNQIGGSKLKTRTGICLHEDSTSSGEAQAHAHAHVDSKKESSAVQSSEEDESRDEISSLKGCGGHEEKVSLRSISVIRRELPESALGWPLLKRTTHLSQDVFGRQNQIDTDSNTKRSSFNSKAEGSVVHSSEEVSTDGRSIKENENCVGLTQEISPSSFSEFMERSAKSGDGWPLLRMKIPATLNITKESETAETSVLQWVMSLPVRSKKVEISDDRTCLSPPRLLPQKQKLLHKLNSSCKRFSYKELKRATKQFSSDNLIGEGGCSSVYKGHLPSGKRVAIKILKRYKEAWNDFELEVDIMSSLKNKHITSLIGICIEDDNLILVYEFLSKGSLEESLEGNSKSVLPWKVRFRVAIAVAEALNYLHNECSPPVIHRDVKSSNILLSNKLQPQLSDFGFAIWGPENSTSTILHSDVVGTFGYIAPEYIMHGRVSDKVDVYAFGIVLLQLLSGKKAISFTGLKGPESLIKWAMPLLRSGNLSALLDPKLNIDLDIAQMQRMVLAATLCTKQSAKLRPKVNQILRLLKGEQDGKEWMSSDFNGSRVTSTQEVDDFFPEINYRPSSQSLDMSFLDLDGEVNLKATIDTTSLCDVKEKKRFKLKDFLQEQQEQQG